MDRIIDSVRGSSPGPLIICVGALHGNEPMGLGAISNVFQKIKSHNIPLKGDLIGIAGNIPAIEKNTRYIDYDMNRCWYPELIKSIKAGRRRLIEDQEVSELLEIIENNNNGKYYTQKILVDLHSTSSDKGNFIVVPEDESEHPTVKALHLPVVVDLHTYLEGTLLAYVHQMGFTSFALEGGLMGTDKAFSLHVSGLWEVLDAAGAISHHDHEVEDYYSDVLQEISSELPKKVKVIYRHWVEDEDQFIMDDGYHNFMEVNKGQQLAKDKNGIVYAPFGGLIFMPLYQHQGNDGFFIVEEVKESILV